MDIILRKGLNIPIEGEISSTAIRSLPLSSFSIDLRPYEYLPFFSSLEEGKQLQKQSIIAEETKTPYRKVTCPIDATVRTIIRGERRKILEVIVDPIQSSTPFFPQMDLLKKDAKNIVEKLKETGLFLCFRQRPLDLLCDPEKIPDEIFVQAIFTAPFSPSAEMQLLGKEKAFTTGIALLQKIAQKTVHVVTTKSSPYPHLLQNITSPGAAIATHTINPLHPAESLSIPIQKISPIRSIHSNIWTLTCLDVITLGNYCLSGDLWTDRIFSITGPSVAPDDREYVRAYPGTSIASLIANKKINPSSKYISGNPLTGHEVSLVDYMRHGQTSVSVILIPEEKTRTFLPFARFFSSKYTDTDTYLQKRSSFFSFTTKQNGERRAFIDTNVYDKIFPFTIPLVLLIKALEGKDLEKALHYGLLEVVPDDFALADFICPSKIPMMEIVRAGQRDCLSYF